jgi:hypothetical protein
VPRYLVVDTSSDVHSPSIGHLLDLLYLVCMRPPIMICLHKRMIKVAQSSARDYPVVPCPMCKDIACAFVLALWSNLFIVCVSLH